MKLTFRTILGKSFQLEAGDETTVGELKSQVQESQGSEFQKDDMKLVYKGKVLADDSAGMAAAGVSEAGFVVVFVQKKPTPAAAPPASPATPAPAAAAAAPASSPPVRIRRIPLLSAKCLTS